MALTGSTNEQKIWNFLYDKIKNAYGVAGLMGNLYAESGLNANNLQNSYNTKLGLTDAQYTEQVDNGTYTNFVKDSAGYGLAQWTYWSRKQNLLNYANQSSASIGDLEMQLNFLYQELSGNYVGVLNILKAATSVLEASNAVLTKFECPADQGSAVQTKRSNYGQVYYNKYANTSTSTTSSTTATATTSTTVLIGHATYNENGSTTGGTAGDQTGGEVCTWTWYSKPWDYMAIYPDANVREKHAACCEAACANDKIGYDQTTRNTLQTQAKAVNYDYSKITTACACDCSALQNSLAVASGSGATYGSNGWTTSTMKSALTALGYKIITDTTYLTSADYCVRGAIYVKAGAHTVCGLTNGSKASETLTKAGITTSTSSNTTSTSSSNTTASSSSSVPNYSGTGIGTAVATTTMNIRTSASTSGTICGTITKGTAVEVLEILSSGWYKIVWAGVSAGYAYTSNANGKYYTYTANTKTTSTTTSTNTSSSSSSSSSTATSTKKATEDARNKDTSLAGDYTATTALNVRNGAGTSANSYGKDKSILVAIPKGTVVHCYGYYTTVSGTKWLYVQFTYKNVKYTGFCSSAYLTKK